VVFLYCGKWDVTCRAIIMGGMYVLLDICSLINNTNVSERSLVPMFLIIIYMLILSLNVQDD
jgi:hypothetical protein